jgi:hypothetical protein
MIKLILISSGGQKDITQYINKVKWSGDYQQAARKIEFDIVSSATDSYLQNIEISLGNMIKFYDNDILIFTGYIFTKNKASNGNEINITAYDAGIYLLKNEAFYNIKDMPAESITAKICKDLGVETAELAKTGILIRHIFAGDTCYEIIMKAYTKAATQNGKKYLALMMGNKLYVIERGTLTLDYVLESGKNLTNTNFSESLENMISAVVIVDEIGNSNSVIGQVNNQEWIKAYGKFQRIYKKETGVNATEVANNLLQGVERRGNAEALGDVRCITGYAVGIKDEYTGLVGVFQIDADTHTWENSIHTMSLQLNFDEIMDEKSYRNKKQSQKTYAIIQWKE